MFNVTKNQSLFIISIVLISFQLINCSPSKVGEPIPENMNPIKISEITKNFKKYQDQKILVEGNFSGFCGTGCCKEFMVKFGIDYIKVNPQKIKVPKYKMGQPIRVYGILKTTKSAPYLIALGIVSKVL